MHRLPRTHAACPRWWRLYCVPAEAALPFCPETTRRGCGRKKVRKIMTWTTPTLVEICIGLEINGYLPAEF
jgi:coenzyme PQQ precursor peptide PqqA